MLSPLLWKKIARGLSAGRVQSVALRAISEREYEISQFNPEEYWEIHSQLKDNKESTLSKPKLQNIILKLLDLQIKKMLNMHLIR